MAVWKSIIGLDNDAFIPRIVRANHYGQERGHGYRGSALAMDGW